MRPARYRGTYNTIRRNQWLAFAVLIACLAALQWVQRPQDRASAPVPPDGVKGRPQIVDGDSFHLDGEEIRLVGIDAPEGRQTCTRNGVAWACGEESRRRLQRLIGGKTVHCAAEKRDQHGRLLAECTAEDRELNREMVASGFAVSYGNYRQEEAAAKAAKRGLWSGEFQSPRDWRRANNQRHE